MPSLWRLKGFSRRMLEMSGRIMTGTMWTICAAVSLLLAGSAAAKNPPWDAPAAAVKEKNPNKASPASLDASAKLYHDNCLTCHGEAGGGNGPASGNLMRKPANFRDKGMMA